MSTEAENPDLAGVAAALARLAPSAGRFNRDQLLFRAGQMSVPRRRWPWPASTALFALAAVALGIAAARRPAPETVERIVYVERPASSTLAAHSPAPSQTEERLDDSPSTSSPLSCYRLEQVALRWGVESLPAPRSAAAVTDPSDSGSLMNMYRELRPIARQ
jgi:hypothetical protein